MKLVSHKELHNEWMQNDEFRAAWREEERKEMLRELLAEWRRHKQPDESPGCRTYGGDASGYFPP